MNWLMGWAMLWEAFWLSVANATTQPRRSALRAQRRRAEWRGPR